MVVQSVQENATGLSRGSFRSFLVTELPSLLDASGVPGMQHAVPSSRRLFLLLAALGVALALLAAIVTQPGHAPSVLPLHDFVEYWAAGRLVTLGENPYDPERMHELERQAGRGDEGILMWNPPWVLPLVAPLGLLDVRTAHLLWMLFHLGVIAFCADVLWRLYDGNSSARIVALLVAFTFLPTWFALLAGQISPLLLLGAVGFLALRRRGNDFAAGAAAVLLAVKPHLAYLFWLALLLWAASAKPQAADRQRRRRVLLGGALTGLALTGIALVLDPGVLRQYWHTFTQQPPEQYRSPTLGTLLRLALGDGSFRWQFLPMLPGLVWLAIHWRRHREAWDWSEQLPLLLLGGMLTAAYGAWPFDLVLLLLPVLALAARLSRQAAPARWIAAAAVHLAVSALALAQMAQEAEYLAFAWMTPALLGSYLCLSRLSHPSHCSHGTDSTLPLAVVNAPSSGYPDGKAF
jgi:hypothetical protein